MKRTAILLAAVMLLAIPVALISDVMAEDRQIQSTVQSLLNTDKLVPGEIIVEYKPEYVGSRLQRPVDKNRQWLGSNRTLVKVAPNQMDEYLHTVLRDPSVQSAQPNYIYETTAWTVDADRAVPNEYNAARHWYYDKSMLPELWKRLDCSAGADCGGDEDVIVAVIDTGLGAFNFDDSAGQTEANYVASSEYDNINLFVNADETPNNQLDDDCNGLVDDVHGVDMHALLAVNTNTCSGNVPQAGY